jgi:beta-phosphoglucomutase-like phosphatase (HAD superfamily)
MLHAIVFDFDGVLADSEPLHFEVFRRVLAEVGITLTEEIYYSKYLGYDDVGAFHAVLRDSGRASDAGAVQTLVAAKGDLFPRLVDGKDVLFPGVAASVRRFAAERPLAIASGAFPHEIELILAGASLRDAFQVVVGAGDTARSKPAPDPYARAVALLQARALVPDGADGVSGCVAIEDSKWGIQSAKAAGLPCVAVTSSYPTEELGEADLVVDSVNTLTIDALEAVIARSR